MLACGGLPHGEAQSRQGVSRRESDVIKAEKATPNRPPDSVRPFRAARDHVDAGQPQLVGRIAQPSTCRASSRRWQTSPVSPSIHSGEDGDEADRRHDGRLVASEVDLENSNTESLCPDQRCLRWPPWLILGLMAAFLAMHLTPAPPTGWLRMGVLIALLLVAAVWFIACFTGDACKKRDHQFVFAYAFTIGAFALLVTPIMSMAPEQEKDATATRPPEGVLQLVRGCTAAGPGVSKDTTAGTTTHSSVLTQCPSGGAWTEDPYAPAAGAPAGAAPRATEVGRQFAWLIAIGGVTSREYAKVLPAGPTAASAPMAGAPSAPATQFVVVHGGLVAPLYVVVLAFIGGAISLSRRLPEYQRRSSDQSCAQTAAATPPNAKPAPGNEPLTAVQVREGIVFQLMQLCSAPFLALATWHMFDPSTVASATVLAFGTGFASEHLLLTVRGMIEGIRPEGSRLSKPS